MSQTIEASFRINGKEVSANLIVGANRPYPKLNFDVDVTEFAGQHVVLEFICDGFPHQWAMANVVLAQNPG